MSIYSSVPSPFVRIEVLALLFKICTQCNVRPKCMEKDVFNGHDCQEIAGYDIYIYGSRG